MYKVYFKQALHILKQDKLISIISIAGTALAITMIMVIYMINEIKTTNIYPEINRNRSLYINGLDISFTDGGHWRTSISYEILKGCLLNLKSPELISASTQLTNAVMNIEGQLTRGTYKLRQTDNNFWSINSFHFIDGKPFSKEEFNSGLKVAVISKRVAKELLNDLSPVGKTVLINYRPYKIIGVVDNISILSTYSFADTWIPYTSSPSYSNDFYNCVILAKNKREFKMIKSEILLNQHNFNFIDKSKTIDLNGPYTISQTLLPIYSSEEAEDEIKANARKNIFILLIALVIPAINLSSFSMSRIRKRKGEIGVRKAFGASKLILITQILYENMITTIIGGFIGFVLSIVSIHFLRNMLFTDPSFVFDNRYISIKVEALFSGSVFLIIFLGCFTLNILSSCIPAIRASNSQIINALKD